MSLENPQTWPLRPSHTSSVLRGLNMALSDLLQEEGGGEISRRAFLKACAMATAAEVFANEVSSFFGNQRGEDEELLEGLEERWLKTDDG